MAASVQIQKVSWWHERLADLMIAHPEATLGQIAAAMNRTLPWVSTVKNSDLFQDYWKRRSEQHSALVSDAVRSKGFAAAELALDLLLDKLAAPAADQTLTVETLLDVVDVNMKRFGYENSSKAPTFNFNLGAVTPEQLAEARQKLRAREDAVEIQALQALPAPEEAGK